MSEDVQDNGDGSDAFQELRKMIAAASKKKKVVLPATESLAQILAEGQKELEKDEKARAAAKYLLSPAQRYELAHIQVLSDLPKSKREVVERCIKNKDYTNRVYEAFIKDVITIAESNEVSES
jgi:hypothetical protein